MIFRIMWAVSDSKRYDIETLEILFENTKLWVLKHEEDIASICMVRTLNKTRYSKQI